MIDVPIRTFTSTFTPSEGTWNFAKTLTPIQYSAYNDLDKGIVTGLYGAVFDKQNIFTTFAYGQKGPHRDDSITGPNYVAPYIRGFVQPPGPANFPVWYNLPIQLGTPAIAGYQMFQDGQSSNRSPASRCLFSTLGAFDTIYSSQQEIPVLQTKYAYALTAGLVSSRLSFQFPNQDLFNTDFNVLCPDRFNRNWCSIGGTVVPSPPNLALVDFSGQSVAYYDVTWDNADINTILNFNQDFTSRSVPTPFGWLYMDNNAVVSVNGKSYGPGFCVLTTPDATQFYLLNIIPTDANSHNWNFSTGTVNGNFLPTGELLIHHNFFDSQVYISAAVDATAYFKILPVFPPVSLPKPPADTEEQLFPYREQNAQS